MTPGGHSSPAHRQPPSRTASATLCFAVYSRCSRPRFNGSPCSDTITGRMPVSQICFAPILAGRTEPFSCSIVTGATGSPGATSRDAESQSESPPARAGTLHGSLPARASPQLATPRRRSRRLPRIPLSARREGGRAQAVHCCADHAAIALPRPVLQPQRTSARHGVV